MMPSFASMAALPALEPTIQIDVEYHLLWPVLIMLGGPLVVLVAAALIGPKAPRWLWPALTVTTAVGTFGAAVYAWNWTYQAPTPDAILVLGQELVIDRNAVWFFFVAAVVVALSALVFPSYLRREHLDGPELYVLSMLCAAGAITMAMANDLIVLFLGLEILSIALYIMAGFHRRRSESGEAAMKYFVLGAFSSALFLYGVALVYGATGSTQLLEILSYARVTGADNGMLRAGMLLILVGLGFKVAAVPFHTWTPDVYQGSPTPVTGYMAALAKAAGFAGLLRVFAYTFTTPELVSDWRPAVWALAVLTLVGGSVLALVQTDVKRMLAYSSINHAGYVLVGLAAVHTTSEGLSRVQGASSARYYLLTYAFIVIGSFAVVSIVTGEGDKRTSIEDFRGLYHRRPFLAVSMTAFLAAQAGVPFTTGFLAKFGVIGAIVDSNEVSGYLLALVAMLVTAVAAYFYLRLVVVMFADPVPAGDVDDGIVDPAPRDVRTAEPEADPDSEHGAPGPVDVLARPDTTVEVPAGTAVVIVVCVAVTIGAGLWAGPLVDLARRAILSF